MLLWRRVSAVFFAAFPERKAKEASGDFLPKLYNETTKIVVSVCSFDSDLLGEGVVERREKERS